MPNYAGLEAKMHTITYDTAARDLKSVILKVVEDKDETIIATNEGAVVILDESEWSHIKETLRLLSDKESLAALITSHAIRDQGGRPEGIRPEEAFRDV
jgi:PHD/YefM family antitoxin component YafN of YafNO toxin-antitoxin module